MSVAAGIVAYLFRWLPHAAPTGLFPVGAPNENSPVVATANFSLTVRRVRRSLRGQDVWLLVANTGGVNVWCSAAGGLFNEHRVIDAITVSRLADKVRGREIVFPALSAPGVDCGAIRRATGFHARFGPVYARDLPAYFAAGMKKTDRMRRFRFDFRHRADMFVSMNFPVYFAIAVLLGVFRPALLAGATILFWSILAILYLLANVLPGKTGWGQAALAAAAFVLGWGALDWLRWGDPLRHGGWLAGSFAIFLAGGFDLAGIATPRKSDPEQFLLRSGCERLGKLFRAKPLGVIAADREKCRGCGVCYDTCPLGVFGPRDEAGKTTFRDRDACFACGACVKQCPESALALRAD